MTDSVSDRAVARASVFLGELGGETGALLRATDWSKTPLGPASSWPREIRHALELVLGSRFPMVLYVGPALHRFYNDGYLALLEPPHPVAFGRPARPADDSAWPARFETARAVLDAVLRGGEPALVDEGRFGLDSDGRLEERRCTFACSAVPLEDATIGAVLCVCADTTARWAGDRLARRPLDPARTSSMDLERARLDSALRRAEAVRGQLKGLTEVAYAGASAGSLEALLAVLAESARRLVPAHQASITIDDSRGQKIKAVSAYEEFTELHTELPDGDHADLASLVHETRRPLRLSAVELAAHPAWRFLSHAHSPMRGFLAAPLLGADGQRIGVIQLFDRAEGEFSEEDEAVLVQLAQMAAAAIETGKLVQQAKDARLEAEAANRAKDEFLAMLGHELRNPLSPIVTALHVMKLHGDTRSIREQAIIERQVEHLVRLVDDLLDVSRITRGKVALKREAVDLSWVIADAVEIAGPLIERRGHHLSVTVPATGMSLEADAARLAQVIANVLTNAAKYTPAGGRIWLTALREGDEVVIEVKDSGIGIAPETLPRIFDLFVQGRRAEDRAEGGLGIGLTIVRNLVQMHGGTVVARSDGPGRGSEFVIRVPTLATDGSGALEPERGSALATLHSRAALRVLVVDDNVDAANMLGYMLRDAGHQVVTVFDGAQALDVVGTFLPQVAVLDIGMPNMDGYELAARLQQRLGASTPRLIALTGYGQEQDRARSVAAGFCTYLVKPVPSERLFDAIEALGNPVAGKPVPAAPGETSGEAPAHRRGPRGGSGVD